MNLQTLHDLIGKLPANVPLNASFLERIQRDGYEECLIQYDVETGERISAFLLIPNARGDKLPALFAHHQHASNWALGKSEVVGHEGDPDQAIGPELARLGYVVLVPDAIGFEERNWSLPTGQAQHLEMTFRLVKGQTLIAKVLHDVSVGIDLLTSLDFVDEERIGFIGHSYGGRMAIWAPAFDQRIKASVSNCGCVNYKNSLKPDVGVQAEFVIPGIIGAGDVEDIANLIAPRALYISATTEDKYSKGAENFVDYCSPNFPDSQLQVKVWSGGHIFTQEMRHAAYRFLQEKL